MWSQVRVLEGPPLTPCADWGVFAAHPQEGDQHSSCRKRGALVGAKCDKSPERLLRFSDEAARMVAVRLRPQQFRVLANGVLGLAEAEV